jgi:2-methylcitrate dehydratase PrpD
VRVRLSSGETFEAATTHPKGDPEAPLSQTEIESKFLSLAEHGDRSEGAERFLDWVRALPTLERVQLPGK